MEKVRMYVDERRKCHMRRLVATIEQALAKRLRAREEEIDKIGRLNWELEERIRSLCVENQIWKDLAQTNEATANALRSNLEQVLSRAKDAPSLEEDAIATAAPAADDAESSCGSSVGEEEEEEEEKGGAGERWRWRCRGCRKEEARVLVLPCRHLCMCAGCGSSTHVCPICKSPKNATVIVNFS